MQDGYTQGGQGMDDMRQGGHDLQHAIQMPLKAAMDGEGARHRASHMHRMSHMEKHMSRAHDSQYGHDNYQAKV